MDNGHSGFSELSPTLYFQLQTLARRYMRRERNGHTYQPTELLNEALARLFSSSSPFKDRQHFFATCARQMRFVLVNHAKAKQCVKRGFLERASTEEMEQVVGDQHNVLSIVELDDLLKRFETVDLDASLVFELNYFGGLTLDETAMALGISEATVTRRLRLAKAWFLTKLNDGKHK